MHPVIHETISTAVLISDIYGPEKLARRAGTLQPRSKIQLREGEKVPQHPPRNTILDIDMQPP